MVIPLYFNFVVFSLSMLGYEVFKKISIHVEKESERLATGMFLSCSPQKYSTNYCLVDGFAQITIVGFNKIII